MPLNMNTVGTGTGIGGGANNILSDNYDIKNTVIDHGVSFDISSVRLKNTEMGSKYISSYESLLPWYDDESYYMYNGNTRKLYKCNLVVNTNSTCNFSSETKTELPTKIGGLSCMVNGSIYFTANGTSNNAFTGKLYKLSKDKSAAIELISDDFSKYASSAEYGSMGIKSYSARKINGSNYILMTFDMERYGNNKPQGFALFEDNENSGCTLKACTKTKYIFPDSNGMQTNGINRFRNAVIESNSPTINLGIYDVNDNDEYVDVYISQMYQWYEYDNGSYDDSPSRGYVTYFEKLLLRFGKVSGILAITIISSDIVPHDSNIVCTGYYLCPMNVSYPGNITNLIIGYSNDVYLGSDGYEYTPYFCSAFTIRLIDGVPSAKYISDTSDIYSSASSIRDAKIPYSPRNISYYSSYRSALLVSGYYDSLDVYVLCALPLDITKSSSIVDNENIVSVCLNIGDLIKSDGIIASYKYNNESEIVLNAHELRITNAGSYEIHVTSTENIPECIIYTKNGSILGCNIEFIDDTHISGYFNKGMTVNGVKTTKSGYQTLTGEFYGRVSISK